MAVREAVIRDTPNPTHSIISIASEWCERRPRGPSEQRVGQDCDCVAVYGRLSEQPATAESAGAHAGCCWLLMLGVLGGGSTDDAPVVHLRQQFTVSAL